MRSIDFLPVLLIGSAFHCNLFLSSACADIVPDSTLPENSRVSRQGNVRVIEGGTQRGTNLFHSFQEFSIPESGTALFRNIDAIANIFARVTGSDRSTINGLIRTNGTANLFLLNPNGILFGDNASLSIGGSFLATTAENIRFDDRTTFSATDPQNGSLLTISAPIGLQFGTPRAIVNRADGLRVGIGETLALVGGKLRFSGGGITSTNGRIELGAIGANTPVGLSAATTGFIPDYSAVQSLQDIQFSSGFSVEASGQESGLIHLQGRNINLSDSRITTSTRNIDNGNAAIVINAAQSLTLQDRSTIATQAFSNSPAGNILIRAIDSIDLMGNGSSISSQVSGTRRGGNVRLETSRLRVSNGGAVSVDTQSRGQAGNIWIRATDSIQLLDTAPIVDEDTPFSTIGSQVSEAATGNGGNVTIETNRLVARNGGAIEASTFGAGQSGNITIRAEAIELSGATVFGTGVREQISSGIFAQVARGAIADAGDAGRITIETQDLTLLGGAQISSAARTGGTGGNVTINASNSIRLSGRSPNATPTVGRSGIFVSAERTATENAGQLNITTSQITVEDNGEISANNFGPGQGGTIRLHTHQLTVRDGGDIRATSFANGFAGDLLIVADRITLDRGQLTANTRAGNRPNANIQIQEASLLLLRNQSRIAARATDSATGGNINITNPEGFVVAAENNNDIVADAFEGRGGNITIAAQSILGLTEQRSTPFNSTSDIDASSEFGAPGSVTLNQINPDPGRGAIELPTDIIDASRLIAQNCSEIGAIARTPSEFVITGRSGLPPSPTEPSNPSTPLGQWIVAPDAATHSTAPPQVRSLSSTPEILEAQGWVKTADGAIVLTVESTTPTQASATSLSCSHAQSE
jgi:filamentous hemagglutinin family protein